MIENAAIIGMGALGLLFGEPIAGCIGNTSMFYFMDDARKLKHENDVYTINGKTVRFNIKSPADIGPEHGKVKLLIIATKYNELNDAIELSKYIADKHTTVISLLNGITSEDIIAKTYDRNQIVDCVPIGMDAMRKDTSLRYTRMGKLQIGIGESGSEERLRELDEFFTRTGVPHEVCDDIAHAMWNKFMINVGINQVCMVYETTYSKAMEDSDASKDLEGAMKEVVAMARAAGVRLTQDDYEEDMRILSGLDPDGYPSMRQDAIAGRKSEVDMFAGTMLELSERYNVPVPVNKSLYERIKTMESGYSGL